MPSILKWLIIFIQVGLLVFALTVAILSSKPFTWPFSWDALRDIGIAQTIYDGEFPQDPILEGEINWYNPFLGIVTAIFGKILHLPLPETYVRIGPFFALLLPISVTLFTSQIGGLTAGLASLCFCIFSRHPLMVEWIYGCYLPWLYATHIGKAFFLLYLTTLLAYRNSDRKIFLYSSGVFLGLTFLTHTSAFIEGSLIAIISILLENTKEIISLSLRTLIKNTKRIFILFTIALFISSPYWLPILIKYQFIVRNPYPSLYLTTALEPDKILITFVKSLNAFTVIGIISLFFLFPRGRDRKLQILHLWGIVILVIGMYQVFCLIADDYGYIFPAPYPLHHTSVSIHLLVGISFGYGVAKFSSWFAGKFSNKFIKKGQRNFFEFLLTSAICATCIYISGYLYSFHLLPPYSELHRGRAENGLVQESQKYSEVYRWLLENTRPEDKIFCDEILAVRVVLPAGRKVVYPLMLYLNIYTEVSKYLSKYNNIWTALREKRNPDFIAFLRKENIKYILVQNDTPEHSLLHSISKLKVVYSDQIVTIFYFIKEKTVQSNLK